MGQERRRAKRAELEVVLVIGALQSNGERIERQITVQAINISSGGIAFKTKETLTVGSFYDTVINLPSGECIKSVIEIVRVAGVEDDETIYGCRFVGINTEDQFRIDVYQIVQENTRIN